MSKHAPISDPSSPSGEPRRFLPWALVAALAVVAIWIVQVVEEHRSAGRRVGIYLAEASEGLTIEGVVPGAPAALAGLESGDRLVSVAGRPMTTLLEYDLRAAEFERGRGVVFEVERDGEPERLEVSPGSPLEWFQLGLSALAVTLSLGLALWIVAQSRGLRARLLAVFLFLLAFEMALPVGVVGDPGLDGLVTVVFLLVTGAQIGVELHLVSMIPDRRAWLVRTPWMAWVFHGLGWGIGGIAAATYWLEVIRGQALPWSYARVESLLYDVGVPLWAVAVVAILASAAWRSAEPVGRYQAAFVLLGVLPWALWSVAGPMVTLVGLEMPFASDEVVTLLLLVYPLAVFVAMFRYHLFDVEMVLRRGLLYTGLTVSLVIAFYALLTGCGVLVARLEGGERPSIWIVSAITLLLGMAFHPLRGWLQEVIDRRFFPERRALRRHLIELAGELPAQGTVPRMGAHLVERLGSIFAVSTSSLLLADPRSGLLLTVAVRGADPDDSFSLSLLLSPDDPGIELLHKLDKPTPAARLLSVSPALRQRFELLDAALLVPLAHQQRLVGVLILGRREGRFAGEELELLNLMAHQVASSFENVRLFESATYESLTGLLRRESTLELLEREIDRARRYDRPLTIGFADLDHFKSVNDHHGHLAGDALLKQVAEVLAGSLRGSDAIGRYGGEEFLLIFPETAIEGASQVAEKLRAKVEGIRLPVDGGAVLEARISIGLASLDLCRTARKPTEALIAAADQALYQAKAKGRNRVETALAAG